MRTHSGKPSEQDGIARMDKKSNRIMNTKGDITGTNLPSKFNKGQRLTNSTVIDSFTNKSLCSSRH